MNVMTIPNLLANNQVNWDTLQREWVFSGHRLMSIWSFFGAALLLGTVIAGLWAWRRYRAGSIKSTPMMIFHQLARGLGISATDEWLLIRISHHESLPTPLTLLLSPTTFEHHTHAYLNTLPDKRRSRVATQVTGLKRFLFDEPTSKSSTMKPTTESV